VTLHISRHNEVAIITLDRPAVLNALSFDQLNRIGAALDEIATSDARALIITGAGEKAFCAGADISELVDRELPQQYSGAVLGQEIFSKLDRLPMPSIALVNGYAFGGGMELALACTFRIATTQAKFALPEIKLGLIPGYGGTQRLPRLIGEARALELILSGRMLLAPEALTIGLVNRVVEPENALEAVLEFAAQFTGYSRMAAGFAHAAIVRGATCSLADGLKIEADLSTLAYRTQDAAEGMKAFLEKRPPRFEDR